MRLQLEQRVNLLYLKRPWEYLKVKHRSRYLQRGKKTNRIRNNARTQSH